MVSLHLSTEYINAITQYVNQHKSVSRNAAKVTSVLRILPQQKEFVEQSVTESRRIVATIKVLVLQLKNFLEIFAN